MEGRLENHDVMDSRRFVVAVRRLADSFNYGVDRSPYLGSGIEFMQSRPTSTAIRCAISTARVHGPHRPGLCEGVRGAQAIAVLSALGYLGFDDCGHDSQDQVLGGAAHCRWPGAGLPAIGQRQWASSARASASCALIPVSRAIALWNGCTGCGHSRMTNERHCQNAWPSWARG